MQNLLNKIISRLGHFWILQTSSSNTTVFSYCHGSSSGSNGGYGNSFRYTVGTSSYARITATNKEQVRIVVKMRFWTSKSFLNVLNAGNNWRAASWISLWIDYIRNRKNHFFTFLIIFLFFHKYVIYYGISGVLIEWLKSYLYNREQVVKVEKNI